MADSSTLLVDLDAFVVPAFHIRLNGAEHSLQALSVDDFVANQLAIAKASADPSIKGQVDLMIEMLCRAFPSVGETAFRKLSFPQLEMLLGKANEHNGGDTGAKEGADANPPPAAADASAS